MEWNEQVVFVTGASKGIGAEIALHFARLGAKVVIGYRSSLDEVKLLTQKIIEETRNPNVTFEMIDVTDRSTVNKAIQNIVMKYKCIDVLVNNAGISYGGALIPSNSLDKWEEIIHTNLMGIIYCINAVSLHMLTEKKGSIVNISSLAGLKGKKSLSVYSASKAGVIGLTRSLAKEYATFNVRVNAVAPGFIEDTGMVNQIPEQQLKEFFDEIAMGHLGKAEDVAEAVIFLASSKSKYITGQTLVVDGGMM